MLIQSLRYHFPARLPEWFMSGWLVAWGMYVGLHPEMFTDGDTAVLFSGLASVVLWTGYPPASVWCLVAISVGFVRAAALFINGAYSRTPIVRLGTSAISAFVVAMIVSGVQQAGVPNLGIVTYSALFLLDLASAYRAASDIPVAEASRVQSVVGRG